MRTVPNERAGLGFPCRFGSRVSDAVHGEPIGERGGQMQMRLMRTRLFVWPAASGGDNRIPPTRKCVGRLCSAGPCLRHQTAEPYGSWRIAFLGPTTHTPMTKRSAVD